VRAPAASAALLFATFLVATVGCDRFERGRRRGLFDPDDKSYLKMTGDEALAGRRRAPAQKEHAAMRVHAKARFVWIRPRPKETPDWLGYLTLGQSVEMRGGRAHLVAGEGPCEAWAPVEPRGWICLGPSATLDADDPIVVALRPYAAKTSLAWPFSYARSLDAPRYRTLPTPEDQKRREGSHLARVERAKAAPDEDAIGAIDKNLVGVDLGPTGEPPPPPFAPPSAVLEGDEDVPWGSTVAYSYEFDHGGRGFVLTADHAVVPLSRLRRFEPSDFRGAALDEGVELPLVFVRKGGRPRWARAADGRLTKTGETWPPRALETLTGREVEERGTRFWETKSGGWLDERDAIVVRPSAAMPPEVPADGRRTWIEVSTVGGWLVAYEGERPVFATLVSAGRGDLKPDGTMAPVSSTPNGTFTIRSKLRTTTMRSEHRPLSVHAEVMYTQVFKDAFALHGAYWHDDFGERRSAGCINLSPIDSRWLFEWSEPAVPPAWHAATTRPGDARTVVVVHL
jgi:hypothetical protein